jgi:molybdate transport system regulatory protein
VYGPSQRDIILTMRPSPLTVRFRVDIGPKCSIGVGKIELLEGIARGGSLSQAARDMRMSYRRAWLLLADLNSSFEEPVAVTSTGGRGGGGVVLTSFGKRLVAGYRGLESDVQSLAAAHMADLSRRTKTIRVAGEAKHAVPVNSIRRKPRSG